MTTPTAIIAGGNWEYVEAVPAAAFSPGHLLEWTSASKLQKNSGDGVACEVIIADMNVNEGEGVSDAYATTDRAIGAIPYPGATARVKLKNGENAAIAAKLCSAGNGEFRVCKSDSSGTVVEDYQLCIALEAVDMSDSSAADPDGWILVRFL